MSIEAILRQKGRNVATIDPNTSLRRAAQRLREMNIAALVVKSADSILGIVSEREIAHAVAEYGDRVASITVKDILVRDFVRVSPEDSLKRAMSLMTHNRTRHLLVFNDRALVGIVSIGDVVKYRLEDLELETNVLRDLYIAAH